MRTAILVNSKDVVRKVHGEELPKSGIQEIMSFVFNSLWRWKQYLNMNISSSYPDIGIRELTK